MIANFITTFAKDHIPIYGYEFIKNYNAFSPFPLQIYAEDFYKQDLQGTYNLLEFNKKIPEHSNFKKNIISLASNIDNIKEKRRLAKALRWSYKSFVTLHALQNLQTKYIVWIDADVVLKEPLKESFIEELIGNKLCMAYKERIKDNNHIESGFVIFNKEHKKINIIIDAYKYAYEKNNILEYNKPWDGFLLAKTLVPIAEFCNLVSPPFSNVRKFLYHRVGKTKFENQKINRYSGRKDLI